MTMRTHTLVMHLDPHQAHTLLEFLDQLREVLLHTYGDDIAAMLQAASVEFPMPDGCNEGDAPF